MAKKKGSYAAGAQRLAAEKMEAKVLDTDVLVGCHLTRTADGLPHLVIHPGSDYFHLLGLLEWAAHQLNLSADKMFTLTTPPVPEAITPETQEIPEAEQITPAS